MKRIFSILFALMTVIAINVLPVNAQKQYNYAGSSRFTDNWSVTLQGGVLTSFNDFYSGHTAMAPIAVLGVDKYINPWFGLGVEGRTLIGTGRGRYNTKTVFDGVNVSGYAKVNLANLLAFNGTRHVFEPVLYTGLGWGHQTSEVCVPRNYMTYRAGAEFNFNLGERHAWAVVLNPSVVWGDLTNGALSKSHGNFEITAGVVYHFNTSNDTRSYAKAKLYDAAEVAALNGKVNTLQAQLDEANAVIKMLVNKKDTVTNTVTTVERVYPKVQFEQGSATLSNTSSAALADIAEAVKNNDAKVTVTGYASVEGSTAVNKKLSAERANAVKNALVTLGVDESKIETVVGGATDKFSPDNLPLNRVTVVK
jgi:OmpA-OmpF porin, OOP family